MPRLDWGKEDMLSICALFFLCFCFVFFFLPFFLIILHIKKRDD